METTDYGTTGRQDQWRQKAEIAKAESPCRTGRQERTEAGRLTVGELILRHQNHFGGQVVEGKGVLPNG